MVLGTPPNLESVSEIRAVWDTAPENCIAACKLLTNVEIKRQEEQRE